MGASGLTGEAVTDRDRLKAGPAAHNGRIAELAPDAMTVEQLQAAAEFEAVRGFAPVGPFALLLHSPALLGPARALGDHLRYHAAIGPTLSELAILLTAWEWSQNFEWAVHAPIAQAAGIGDATIEAIANGEYPVGMSGDEAIVYDFSTELLRTRQVSDPAFARAVERFGQAGVTDLVALHGYYGLLAMQLNVARYEPPPGSVRLPVKKKR